LRERLKYAKKVLQKNFEPKLPKMAKVGQKRPKLAIFAYNSLKWAKMAKNDKNILMF